jgi:hypothetical protein
MSVRCSSGYNRDFIAGDSYHEAQPNPKQPRTSSLVAESRGAANVATNFHRGPIKTVRRENRVNQSGSVALSGSDVRAAVAQVIDDKGASDPTTKQGAWVQVLPDAPNFKGLGSENQVLFPAVGPLWDSTRSSAGRRRPAARCSAYLVFRPATGRSRLRSARCHRRSTQDGRPSLPGRA